jgi:hypothetical protein
MRVREAVLAYAAAVLADADAADAAGAVKTARSRARPAGAPVKRTAA